MTGEFGSKERSSLINLAETPDFDVGGLRVSPAHREVSMNGERRDLEPRVAQVLVALASARPAVVSRDRLIEQCWDGRIVGDDAINRCILALRHLAREFSPPPFEIETVARVGYSLVAAPSVDTPPVTAERRDRRRLAIGALLALLMISAAVALGWLRLGRAEAAPASIAVLPFRNVSSGDPYFAEGVSEEISGQLAREPAFRVTGRASAAQFAGPSDPRKVGRALGVEYVLEGSVRAGTDRVRVNASLIKTSDGTRLWSETYDRKLDDILEIQIAIGQAVARGLERSLLHATAGPSRAVTGETYALYLNARGILQSANPQSGHDAIGLLQQVIGRDQGYAPAWSSLAEALLLDARTKGPEGLIAVMPQASNAARRALQLDPDLAQAYVVSAQLVGLDSPAGIALIQRAAELAPGGAEGALSKAIMLNVSGRFTEAYAARQRAHDLDPLAPRLVQLIVDAAASFGDRAAAEAAIRRGFHDDLPTREFAMARAAWFSGDFSEAARKWSQLATGQSRWAGPSRLSLENALRMLKLAAEQPSRASLPTIGENRSNPTRVWMTEPPSALEWQRRNRSSAAELVYRDENVIAAKLMLNAGRALELVKTYDGPTGLLGIHRGQQVGTCYLQNAAIVALSLRAVGRHGEANDVLRQSEEVIQAAYRRGTVPLWFDEDAAGIWALQGKPAAAVDALDRALRRGSTHSTHTDLPQLTDEPALRSLRGNASFLAVLAKYDAHFAREREEAARALKIPVW